MFSAAAKTSCPRAPVRMSVSPDALADLDGVDLAAAHGQRALRALERRG